MSTQVWSNVQASMQSALGANLTITGITQANPGVATSTAHGLSNGDIVVLNVQGMYQIDKKPVRVSGVAANTFQLEGVDTTSFNAFTSGYANKVTLGTTFTTIADLSVSGGDFEMIDVTTIHDQQKQTQPGAATPTEISGNFNWDPSDAGQVAAKSAADAKALRVFKISFASGASWLTYGYIGFTGAPTGSAQGKVTSPFKISAYGRPTFYAS